MGVPSNDGYRPRPKAHIGIKYDADEDVTPVAAISKVAHEDDNCAIAIRRLPCGLRFSHKGRTHRLSHTVLEGHRFVIDEIPEGGHLMSWSLPFGIALRPLLPGTYCCNDLMLKALSGRRDVDFEIPAEANFLDPDTSASCPYVFDESTFIPGKEAHANSGDELATTFQGFARTGGRGVGTRNKVILVGLTVASASFVRELERRLGDVSADNVDGIVAVAHNEGEGDVQNNKELLLRTIAGFLVHPNTGAALIVATGRERNVTLEELKEYMAKEQYPSAHVPHDYAVLSGSWREDLKQAEDVVRGSLVPAAAKYVRSAQPVSALRIALQCGGSDAFSGLTGNPLVGEVSKLLIEKGGLALLAESPELVGAEPYVLSNCRNLEIARKFLMMTERYKRYASRHGQDAAGNPSGGNLYRGLYNIVIKSLGASRKKPPDVVLDECIEYSERVGDRAGYFFMDSPGNDLESIAGQVASGCNVIFFVTGNGAITNFPFVPTLKVVTTSGRFRILQKEMDVNAGLLTEGIELPELARRVYGQMLDVVAGTQSKGEMTGISQVSIWRNWFLDDAQKLSDLQASFNFEQQDLKQPPVKVKQEAPWALPEDAAAFVKNIHRNVQESTSLPAVNLILPTSLCSSEVARSAATRLASEASAGDKVQFVALPHTEGCGGAGGAQCETIFQRVMLGHLLHPRVQRGFLLEHGCEKTHNDWFAARLKSRSVPLESFGWASVQMDGGIEAVYSRISDFFKEPTTAPEDGCAPLRLALLAAMAPGREALLLAELVRAVVFLGGTVLLPSTSPLLKSDAFLAAVLYEEIPGHLLPPTLAYAQIPSTPGLHVMEVPSTASSVEVVAGLAPAVHCFLTWMDDRGLQPAHPFVPTVHAAEDSASFASEADVSVDFLDTPNALVGILQTLEEALRGGKTKAGVYGAVDFSVTRGITSVSL